MTSILSSDCCVRYKVSLNMPAMRKFAKQWRLAFATIYSFRAIVTSAKIAKKFLKKSPSYTLISIHDEAQSARSDQPCSFRIDQSLLTKLVKEKDLRHLQEFGGVKKVASTLETDVSAGISGNPVDVSRRQNAFGINSYKEPPAKGFFHFVYEAFKDLTIMILLVCAGLSLGFGIKENGVKEGWYDGGSIFVAVFLVIAVSAMSNYRQNRQFEKLSRVSGNILIDVIRKGRGQQVSIFEIVVGDVVCLKIGDQVPADGLLLEGHSLQVDESSMTGESDHVEVNSNQNPFLFSGTKVADGYAQMLVTSVGVNTTWGMMMSSIIRDNSEQTPLQVRLNKLTSSIGKVGLAVAFLVLVVLLIRYFTGNTEDENRNPEFITGQTTGDDIINSVVGIIAVAVTIVVVAIPEGLPLAVTLTLAYSMKRMMADQAMVRKLSACETMGSATTICTDKTGTLTMNRMKVTKFWVGQESLAENTYSRVSNFVLDLIRDGVALNTMGSVYRLSSGSGYEFSGSPTEKAILSWAVSQLNMDMEEIKKSCEVIQVEPFNSQKKKSGVLIKKSADDMVHVHWKGAAEMVLAMCSSFYDGSGVEKDLDKDERMKFEQIIQGMAGSSLRCIAFAHKQVSKEAAKEREDGKKIQEESLTLLGFVGIKDPCRPGVRSAVQACQDAGVNIKMITGDNIFTAKAIAIECGILRPGDDAFNGAIVEGADFRNYTLEERLQRVEKILVMARSSPFDKLLMVQCLKQNGHVVAVTGDGTNDAPALKEADIGLSMGIQGTEVAKESSDIVILDDNFASVVTVLRWGRCVYTNIQKFIQFQLTVNVAALVINFVAAVSSGNVPLTAVQLLWVNLIMDTFGALALATERPTRELMEKPPVGRTEPLITNVIWRNLVAQAMYQMAILLTLQFKGESIFGVDEAVKRTLIFNAFVLCQVFNEFNARKLEKKNVFEGIKKSKLFLGIIFMTVVLQVAMVEFLKRFADTERLTWGQWGACVGIAAASWPIGWVVKCIPVPDTPIFSYLGLKSKKLVRKIVHRGQ
ncbi:putative calcium-transporting ATPase 13, plasma membrane-type [Eucalyptus grandis]|uniref:putative calcium-transporting ATPase 13, plasma membrane-type n=1 Tax=Eucalyptus grandis TaxID=71139 RepID=UPI00192EED04|nr:putative calcium-transporting ATPase 13, plasma membrane-type [Eucalyptus grandis]XP_039155037.1 putative calcium-transporting ATPase 13, plasma membrane-type [Eucalyptus grandis]